MGKIKEEKGLLSLEASISLTIFLFLMLFMYSFFVVFEARNVMAHTLLATAKSMALDNIESEQLRTSDLAGLIYRIYNISRDDNDEFASILKWSSKEGLGVNPTTWDGAIYVSGSTMEKDAYGNTGVESLLLLNVIKQRFNAYLAGGDRVEADKLLKKYHIVNGVDGLDFSGSHIKSGKLYIKLKYKLEYEFNMFGWGTAEFEQSACSKLW